MRSFVAVVALAALAAAQDRCRSQSGGHTNAICCDAGTSFKDVSPGEVCDYETDADKCQKKCCGSTCLSRNVECPNAVGYTNKAAFDTIASAVLDSEAVTLATCCVKTCKSMTTVCPTGKNKIADFDTQECTDKANCENVCCTETCASAPTACATGLAQKAAYATIACAPGGCDADKCCERTCKSMSIVCPTTGTPLNKVESFDTLLCANQGDCETKCCKNTCATAPAVACTAMGLTKEAKYDTIECAAGACDTDTCCTSTCKSKAVNCGTGYIKLADYDTIGCAGAADTCVDTCCEKTCTHTDHAKVCDAIGSTTFQLKRESATIACSTGRTTGRVASRCDNELCCDLTRVARDVNTIRATLPHTLVSCVENADCRKNGDAGATCDAKTNECTCTNCVDYNFKGFDTLEWENTRCYQKKETHNVVLIFEQPTEAADVCKTPAGTNAIPKDVRNAIVAVYTSFSGGKVLSAEFLCIASKVSVSLKVELVKGAVLKTDTAAFNTALAGQTTAIKNKLGGAVKTVGTAAACGVVENVAERLSVAGSCLVQKCNVGYYKNKDTRVCTKYISGTGAGATVAADEFDYCVVDSDCTWRTHIASCVENKCVLDLAQFQTKLRKPTTGSDKNWCTDDASCTAFGDVNATCSKNVGLGNWCSCAHGDYDYPAGDLVGLCVPTAATKIKFGYTVVYETGLACPTTEAQVEGFTALIRKVLGDDAAKVAHRCTGARVDFLGVADMDKALAVDLAGGGSAVFVAKLVAERAVGKAAASTTMTLSAAAAAAAGGARGADVLADPYAGLGDAVPTSATVGAPLPCTKPFATSTARYNTECIALDCQATHSVIGADCIMITPVPNTTAPGTATPPVVVASDDDSGLSAAEKAGLGIGITVGVLLIIGVIVAVVMCSKKSEGDEAEPTKDVDGEAAPAHDETHEPAHEPANNSTPEPASAEDSAV